MLGNMPSSEEAEMLRGIVEEISAVAPVENEDEVLAQKHKLAANSHEILAIARRAVNALNEGENSLMDALADVYRDLEQLPRLGAENAESFLNELALIRESVESLAGNIESFSSSIELDEAAFAELENRLSAIYTLKRHYGPTLESVINRWHEAEERLRLFKDFRKLQQECREKVAAAEKELQQSAEKLSAARKDAAGKFSAAVAEKLKVLGFEYNYFTLDFSRHDPELSGMDTVDMMFSANPGLQPAPLRLIASSGEIARVMLAVKAVLADAVPVLIFDEIDVNIGGETGLRVGEELANLARHRQLLCISHLPQVAALGEHHYAVAKHIEDANVYGSITLLDKKSRPLEIARMLGGTEAALAHARALLKK